MTTNYQEIYQKSLKDPWGFWSEIADNIYSIDRSMRWGFGWDKGPFQAWDIIGLKKSIARMKDENKKIRKAGTVKVVK